MMHSREEHWGTADGKQIFLFRIGDENGLTAVVSNYGGILQSLIYTRKDGSRRDVVLGYDTLEAYRRSNTFFGACIGPIADRMRDGACRLNGEKVQLPLNAGPDSMHCAEKGFHSKVFDYTVSENQVRLTGIFDREQTGFPGRMYVRITYTVIHGDTLRIEYSGKSDCETAFSMTNHSYFNLDGGENNCLDHVLTVFADAYAETEREQEPITTGKLISVMDTPFDLRKGCAVRDVIAHNEFHEIQTGGGLDHYFAAVGEGLRKHAVLSSPESGIRMECRSDLPGLLVYSANGLECENGKSERVYRRNYGICLETGKLPNAVNMEEYRKTVVLKAGEEYNAVTEYTLSEA